MSLQVITYKNIKLVSSDGVTPLANLPGVAGDLIQDNFLYLADTLESVSGTVGLSYVNSVSGYLAARDISISGYLDGKISAGSVSAAQLSNVSGYLDARDLAISGYLLARNASESGYSSAIYSTITNLSNTSGYFFSRINSVSGYLDTKASNIDILLSSASGYLEAKISTASGYNENSFAKASILTNTSGYFTSRMATVSGYLDNRDISISGYLDNKITTGAGSGATYAALSDVSGYLAARDISISGYNNAQFDTIINASNVSGYLYGRTATVSGYSVSTYDTITNASNVSGYLYGRVATVSGYSASNYNTITNTSNVSGYLDGRDISISGYFTAINIVGPSSSTDNAVVRFDGTNGKLAQNSFVTISDNGVLSTSGRIERPIRLTDASGITTDASLGSYFKVLLSGNRTLWNPINSTEGQIFRWYLRQDVIGSRTITLDNKFSAGPYTVTLTTTPSGTDILAAIYDAERDRYFVTGFAKGY